MGAACVKSEVLVSVPVRGVTCMSSAKGRRRSTHTSTQTRRSSSRNDTVTEFLQLNTGSNDERHMVKTPPQNSSAQVQVSNMINNGKDLSRRNSTLVIQLQKCRDDKIESNVVRSGPPEMEPGSKLAARALPRDGETGQYKIVELLKVAPHDGEVQHAMYRTPTFQAFL